MSDFFRLATAITAAHCRRQKLPVPKTDATAEELAKARDSLEIAGLFPADPLELAALKREYAREDAESRHACDLPGSGE